MNNNREIDMDSAIESPAQAGLKWLFLDLNSYFASVEQQDNPDLIGKPVAVLPTMTDSTCAIAASYEAKAFGIKTGTKIYEAKRMCPGLICIQATHGKYVEYHHRILEATEKVLPVNKVWSVDEFDCELLGRERIEENAIKIANNIKESIYQNVGQAIRCSIGIAPNSFLAKVGTEIEKPNGLVLLKPEDLPGRLLDLKLNDLPGIGPGNLKRLQRCGITSIEQLYNISPKQARSIWRSVQGERFWYWLHGYDVPYQTTSPSMMGHSRMLDPHLRGPEKTRLMARRLLFKACTRLRKKDLFADNLLVKITFLDRRRWVGFRDFPASQDPFTMMQMLDSIWNEFIDTCFNGVPPPDHQRLFLKISTLLFGLKKENTITNDLFDVHIEEQSKRLEKQNKLTSALDELQQKYQKETVWLGVVPETLAGNVGTKIAFNRVPDKEEFQY